MNSDSEANQSPPQLIIHAGTHKTASTYIQERLQLNRDKLKSHRCIYQYPSEGNRTFKTLVSDICRGDWQSLIDHIDQHQRPGMNLLLSAEQFAVPLTHQQSLNKLKRIAKQRGFQLKIIIFIRSQLDYINSRYTYSLRRFYHTKTFEEFLQSTLEGQLPGESHRRGKITKRNHLFDFWTYFQPLLKAKAKGLQVTFIPFKQNEQDPFDQFLTAIGLSPQLSWKQCGTRFLNRSPGIRGVWLSRTLGQLLHQAKISHRKIEGSSKIILKEEIRRHWNDKPFWGYTKKSAKSVMKKFSAHNDLFAQQAWNTNWREAFPQDIDLVQRKYSAYRPKSIHDELYMHAIANHLFRMIEHRIKPKPWHPVTDNIERIITQIHPRLTPAMHRQPDTKVLQASQD